MIKDMYINGSWQKSSATNRLPIVNPYTNKVVGNVTEGAASDVDVAVAAARAAFKTWSTVDPMERAKVVHRLADEIEQRLEEFADSIVLEISAPRKFARWAQANLGVMDLRSAANGVAEIKWSEELDNIDAPSSSSSSRSLIVREPIGVVGCITPWNYPLHQITAKVGAALCAGCTVVVKPSELSPITAQLFTEAVTAAGVPPGVFNLVNGIGTTVGGAIAGHPDIDMVSFTGSTAVGKQIAAVAAQTVKRVSLELGGKSASIILDDADLELAVKRSIRGCYLNAGQSCNALSRMLVPSALLPQAEVFAKAAAERLVMGDPNNDATLIGPIVNAKQRDRVLELINSALDEGARLVTGGPKGVHGNFVPPTVLSDVTAGMRIAQEEVFGPVVAMMAYDDVDEAVEIANGTLYGLAAAVWSRDDKRALEVGLRLRAGQIEVNGGLFNPRAPFGGYKQSGAGREGGAFGIEEYLEIKSLQL